MTDYGHDLLFGSFVTPSQQHPEHVVALAQLSEQLGLDLVTFQDHPYQPAFLDTWTLMSYVAASTISITVAPNVLNLPLRGPAVVARAAASLDRLSGGRFELALGAGAFWDAMVAMGANRLSPGESVEALAEAIDIIRQLWDTDTRGGVRVEGRHHQVLGAKRGPAPAHPMEIWLGALKPRILRLTGRAADGWLPSSTYLPPTELAAGNAIIDRAALDAGRQPSDIRRLYNLSGAFSPRSSGFLQGPPEQWVDELSELALDVGVSTFLLASDDPGVLTTYAEQVVPALRESVAERRARGPLAAAPLAEPRPETVRVSTDPGPTPGFAVPFTPDDGTRLTTPLWDEDMRPSGPAPQTGRTYTPRELAAAQQLVTIHDHLRAELTQIRDLVAQVLDGSTTAGAARGVINEMTLRQNSWTVGAYCAAYCRLVATHHTIEDQEMFPRLRRADPALAPVVERLHAEHEIIHEVLEAVDQALVGFVGTTAEASGALTATGASRLQLAIDQLTDSLLSHLSYEERELVEPLARLNILV